MTTTKLLHQIETYSKTAKTKTKPKWKKEEKIVRKQQEKNFLWTKQLYCIVLCKMCAYSSWCISVELILSMVCWFWLGFRFSIRLLVYLTVCVASPRLVSPRLALPCLAVVLSLPVLCRCLAVVLSCLASVGTLSRIVASNVFRSKKEAERRGYTLYVSYIVE